MSKTISPEERSRRAALIRQAIARGAGRFFGGTKLLYPVSDYILLAFQRPVCFSIWKRDGELAYTTFRDPAIVSSAMLKSGTHLKHPGDCKVDLSVLSPCLKEYFVTLHYVSEAGFEPMDAEGMNLLEQILDPEERPPFPHGFPEVLLKAIVVNSNTQWIDSDCNGAVALSDEQIAKYLEPLRDALDEVMAELLEHKSFSVTLSTGVSVPNLFAVVRTVRSTAKRFAATTSNDSDEVFPYTASLLLSNVQRDLLPAICDDSNCDACIDTARSQCQQKQYPERCISLLETPLSVYARSIFDSVYYSGCVDFGLPGKIGEAGQWRDKVILGGAEEDIQRREVEKCVYGVLSKGRSARIMYVPIHVGGSPWISLFTFTDADDESAWDDNYCFYRDIIAKLSDRIRSVAQGIYIQTLVDDLEYALGEHPNQLFDEVEERWKAVSQVFPFRRHLLTQCSSSTAGALRLPRGVYAALTDDDNSFCHPQIDYGHVALEKLKESISTKLTSLELIDIRANEGIRNQLTSQAHTFLNVLLSIKGTLDSALHENNIPTVHKYARDAASNAEILEASLRVALDRPLPDTFPKDILSMLNWLYETASYGDLKPEPSWNSAKRFAPFSSTEETISAFTVLWNLWDNAARVARGKLNGWFKVSMEAVETDKYARICFTNLGEMPGSWVDYINDQGPSPNTEKRPCGLEIVKDKIHHELKWGIECQVENDGTTRICLKIPEDALNHLENRRSLNARKKHSPQNTNGG
jgi:hypothetical protein